MYLVRRGHRVARVQWRSVGRRWESNVTKGSEKPTREAARKERQQNEPPKRDVEAEENSDDGALMRLLGSDWGDRRGQKVSLPMKIYWGIFLLVIGNGIFTSVLGKDEKFFVNKAKRQMEEKTGQESVSEYDESEEQVEQVEEQVDPVEQVEEEKEVESSSTPPPRSAGLTSGVMSSSAMGSANPFMHRQYNTVRRPQTKEDLQQQLQELRARQAKVEEQMGSQTWRSQSDLESEIRSIELQKRQVKDTIKELSK